MASLSHWWHDFRVSQQIADITANHKRRAMLYDLLKNYTSSIPSLFDAVMKIRDRRRLDGDVEFQVFDEIVSVVEHDNVPVVEAMARMFPPDEVMLIEAASQKGHIHLGFERAMFIAEKRAEAKGAIKMALAYPLYVLLTGIFVFYLILDQSIPQLVSIQTVEKWPAWTKPLHFLYWLIIEHPLFLAVPLVALVIFIIVSLKFTKGPFRNFFDHIAPWSIQKRFQAALFLIAMGDLLKNGYSFPRALEKSSQYANPYLLSFIDEIDDNLTQNMSVGDSLDVGLINKQNLGFLLKVSHISDSPFPNIQHRKKYCNNCLISLKVTSSHFQNTCLCAPFPIIHRNS